MAAIIMGIMLILVVTVGFCVIWRLGYRQGQNKTWEAAARILRAESLKVFRDDSEIH